jgi:hypothetical protein
MTTLDEYSQQLIINIVQTIKLSFNYERALHPECETIKLNDLFKVLDMIEKLNKDQLIELQNKLIKKSRELRG